MIRTPLMSFVMMASTLSALGAHGASRDTQYGTTALWPTRAEEWMRANGWLTK